MAIKPSDHFATGEIGDRIQKVLSQLGLGSRRQVETWIAQGRVRVNGKLASLGDRLKDTDQLVLNGRPVDLLKRTGQPLRVLVYYKPEGELVTRRDPQARPVIFTQLPKLKQARWIAVGRLDINTQGLLIVTNNGELANRLMHPSRKIEREYAVRILGQVSEEMISNLRSGVLLDDGVARFEDIQAAGGEGANRWYKVVLSEGRNRIVRRLWESQRLKVSRLIRVRYGPALLPTNLKPRTFYELKDQEKSILMGCVGMQHDRTERRQRSGAKHRTTAARRKEK
jgi:23S rRNA pseudouridine2605 synthase